MRKAGKWDKNLNNGTLTNTIERMLVKRLINNTEIQKELVEWKKKCSNNDISTVGARYWKKIMTRHHSIMEGKNSDWIN